MASPSSSLPDHLDTLFRLACILVGPEHAPDVLRRMVEHVAQAPPSERPNDLSEWAQALLREADDFAGTPTSSSDSAPLPSGEHPLPLQREAADRIVEEALPVAFAACSSTEQARLTLAVIGPAEASPALLEAAETPPQPAPNELLWSTLRELLSPPEFRLVEATYTDADLREALHDFLAARLPSVPGSLRTELRTLLETAPAPDPSDSTPEKESADDLPERPTPRSLVLAVVVGLLVLAGGVGVAYLGPSASPPASSTPSLVAFSAERADDITPDLTTNSAAEAEAYVRSTWTRRVTVPALRGGTLRGVGRVRTAGVEVPVFLYDADGARITAFAYSYALLRMLEPSVRLPTSTRSALAQSRRLVSADERPNRGLLWRDRDDIFVVVSPTLPPDSLRGRLRLDP